MHSAHESTWLLRSLQRLLVGKSTRSSHCLMYSLTSAGASHSAQWFVATDLLVMLVHLSSIPLDSAGGKAASFVAWMKRNGISMVIRFNLSTINDASRTGLQGRQLTGVHH